MPASRKLYVEIAKSLQAALTSHGLAAHGRDRALAIGQCARLIAGDLANDNPRFDERRFFAACGLTDLGWPVELS